MRAWSFGFLFALTTIASAGAQTRAGVASISIAPSEPAWLAGYARRDHPSEFASGNIRARALAIDDGSGGRVVLISVELLAVPRALTELVAARIMKALGLDRGQILINASGTHNAPFVRELQPDLAPAGAEEQRRIAEYSAWLSHSLVELASASFSNMQSARIGVAFGHASFAVNASLRTAMNAAIPTGPTGPVDTAVPVLRVSSTTGRTLAVVFGYACRAAALGAGSYALSGDYAGVAAAKIERDFPGSVALFLRLCDGDQSPRPRGSSEFAALHGAALAAEVRRLLESPMQTVTGPLHATLIETSLAFAHHTRAELETEAKSQDPIRARWAMRLLATDEARSEMHSMPYPVQVIRFGKSFSIVALAGEPAVSYALKIRKLLVQENLIVAGGTNDAGYFVPGTDNSDSGTADSADSIFYSGLPGAFTSEAEERILDAVKRAWKRVLK